MAQGEGIAEIGREAHHVGKKEHGRQSAEGRADILRMGHIGEH